MLELVQSIHVLAGVFILAVLMLLLVFGIRGLRSPRPDGRRADPHYAHLLRKMPF